eukprot:2160285-Pyramimonas_sp.AAC.1
MTATTTAVLQSAPAKTEVVPIPTLACMLVGFYDKCGGMRSATCFYSGLEPLSIIFPTVGLSSIGWDPDELAFRADWDWYQFVGIGNSQCPRGVATRIRLHPRGGSPPRYDSPLGGSGAQKSPKNAKVSDYAPKT